MININLQVASNGIIKRVRDDNYNGAGEPMEIVNVYETEEDKNNSYKNIIRFFEELSDDLCLDLGNKYDKETLSFDTSWGTHYEPNIDEIRNIIKNLTVELKELKDLEKLISNELKAKDIIESVEAKK